MQFVSLEVPARLEFVSTVRRCVAAAAGVDRRWTPEQLADLELVVSEACTNAIQAQAAARTCHPVAIRCALGEERIEVTVEDRGGGFEIGSVPEPPAAEDPSRLHVERGLGVHLMRVIADEADFVPSERGTRVRLVLERHRPGP
jgi:serine/threonine-protein kinase RsbW